MPNRRFTIAAIGVLAMAAGSNAYATTFAEMEFVCPIGGEEFEASVVLSNSSWGQRPDGKPYSHLPVYPVTECPENGFLLFDEDFTEEDLQVLKTAIATDEFQAMRETETQHYRVWWLKNEAGRDEISQLSSLLRAGWETDHDYDRKVKYQSQFANLALNMERTEENAASWFYYNMRAVNILRELGYFDEGLKRLDFLMRPEHLPQGERQEESALSFADDLKALLEQKNPFFEPANLVPEDVAFFRCAAPKSPLTEIENAACASEAVTQAIGEFRHKTEDGKKLKGKEAVLAADREWRSAPHAH
jgi:hypothetical protein